MRHIVGVVRGLVGIFGTHQTPARPLPLISQGVRLFPALAQERGSGSTGFSDLHKCSKKPVEPLIFFHPYPDHHPRGWLCPPCPLPPYRSLQVASGS